MKRTQIILIVCLFLTVTLKAQKKLVLFPVPQEVKYNAAAKDLSLQGLTIYLSDNAPKDVSFAVRELKQMLEERAGKKVRLVNSLAMAKVNYTIKNKKYTFIK